MLTIKQTQAGLIQAMIALICWFYYILDWHLLGVKIMQKTIIALVVLWISLFDRILVDFAKHIIITHMAQGTTHIHTLIANYSRLDPCNYRQHHLCNEWYWMFKWNKWAWRLERLFSFNYLAYHRFVFFFFYYCCWFIVNGFFLWRFTFLLVKNKPSCQKQHTIKILVRLLQWSTHTHSPL